MLLSFCILDKRRRMMAGELLKRKREFKVALNSFQHLHFDGSL